MDRREFHRMLLSAPAVLSQTVRDAAARDSSRQYEINPQRLRESLEALSAFGRNPEGGVSRVAWTQADIEARRFVTDTLMSGIGLEIRIDPAGSIYRRGAGRDNRLPVLGKQISVTRHGFSW